VSPAQQTPPPTEHTTTIQLQPKTPLNDKTTLISSINGSYYHPDSMTSLGCDVSVDWPAFFTALKMEVPQERLKTIQGLKMRMKAQRDKAVELTFDWTGGAPTGGQEQLESGLKQMLGGFFQFYWSMAASPLIAKPSEITKTEPIAGAGMNIYTSGGGGTTVTTVDKDYTPTHFAVDTPAMKGSIDAHYLPSPSPVAGDLRRISSMNLTEQIGTSHMDIAFDIDYQSVDDFNVPKHVGFDVSGAYSIKLELSGCTVSK